MRRPRGRLIGTFLVGGLVLVAILSIAMGRLGWLPFPHVKAQTPPPEGANGPDAEPADEAGRDNRDQSNGSRVQGWLAPGVAVDPRAVRRVLRTAPIEQVNVMRRGHNVSG